MVTNAATSAPPASGHFNVGLDAFGKSSLLWKKVGEADEREREREKERVREREFEKAFPFLSPARCG